MDIALLLPPEQAKKENNLILSPCRFDLEDALHKAVDLLNLRRVSTVMQKEIIGGGGLSQCDRLLCADPHARAAAGERLRRALRQSQSVRAGRAVRPEYGPGGCQHPAQPRRAFSHKDAHGCVQAGDQRPDDSGQGRRRDL